MQNTQNIQEELKEVSSALLNANANVFVVPVNYFEQLSEEIMVKIRAGVEGVYYFPKQMPYTIPVQYFDHFSHAILQQLKAATPNEVAEELHSIAPILNTINKQPLYSLPDNYFNKIIEKKPAPAKIITPLFRTNVFKYLAAAVIAGAMATGIFLVAERDVSMPQAFANPKAEVKNLSENEIVDFLKTTSFAGDVTFTGAKASTQTDINQSVNQMTDDEIQKFLDENGETDGI